MAPRSTITTTRDIRRRAGERQADAGCKHDAGSGECQKTTAGVSIA